MHHREKRFLEVRRIAIVFDVLLPDDVPNDTLAFRLACNADLLCDLAGAEIIDRGTMPLHAIVPGARKGFIARADARRIAIAARFGVRQWPTGTDGLV